MSASVTAISAIRKLSVFACLGLFCLPAAFSQIQTPKERHLSLRKHGQFKNLPSLSRTSRPRSSVYQPPILFDLPVPRAAKASGVTQSRVTGETLATQWSKSFSNSQTDIYPEKFDIDSDGIPELLIGNYGNGATMSFYDGGTGDLKTQLTVTKPHPDWEIYMDEDIGYYCSNAGECYSKLQDLDADGSKEYFVQLSSASSPTSVKAIAQIYDAATKTLKWQSSETTLSWGAQQSGWIFWNVVNMDNDSQKELALIKQQYDSSSGQSSTLDIFIYDGASKSQQWAKTGLANVEFYEEDTLLDINSDNIPEVYFSPMYNSPAASITFYDGSTGNAVKEVTLTKTSSDWVPRLTYYGGNIYSANGGGHYTLFDVDGDGSKEFFITLSSQTATNARSIAQLYDAATGALKWQSAEATISWGAGQYGGISWSVFNGDDDAQKEILQAVQVMTSGPPFTSETTLKMYDGSTKSQQWANPLSGIADYYDPEELRDIDSDGIPEILGCDAASCKFYEGKTGTVKAELTPTKPNSDWRHYSPWTGWGSTTDGDNSMKLYDFDRDGNKEILVQLTSTTATAENAIVQIYNATTMALKWQSETLTLALGAGEFSMFECIVGNIDTDSPKEFIISLAKYNDSTSMRSGTLTAYEYSVPGAAVTPGAATTVDTEAADLSVPAGAFPVSVSIAVGAPASVQPPSAGQTATGISVSITVTPAAQPARGVTLSIPYTLTAVSGMNEDQLAIARYDETSGKWIPLQSTVNKVAHTVTAVTDHFSVFQIMQVQPSSSVSAVTMGPNPYRPSSNPGQTVTFRNLPSGATVKIFTYSGELLRELQANASGIAAWDGKNEGGKPVASGIYLALIKTSSDKKIFKIMVER